jgi:DNA-directed RNA polymerase subunit RPC12/RpoP
MALIFNCSFCGEELHSQVSNAGELINCKNCSQRVLVPENMKGKRETKDEYFKQSEKIDYKIAIPPQCVLPIKPRTPEYIQAETKDSLLEFWGTTWSAWRSLVLSSVSNTYAQAAKTEFETFMKNSANVNDPILNSFLSQHPPRPGEFLIAFSASDKRPAFVLTSLRLWMYDNQNQQYMDIELENILDFESKKEERGFKVKTRLKDNTECTYEIIEDVPSDKAIKLAIKRSRDFKEKSDRFSETVESAETASLLKDNSWFIKVDSGNGEMLSYNQAELASLLRANILDGKHKKDSAVVIYTKTADGNWTQKSATLLEYAKNNYKLRVLYQPVWAHAMAGLKLGAVLGAILKILDTALLIKTVNPGMAILFAVMVAACVFIRKWTAIAALAFIIGVNAKANLFLMALAALLVGAILGSLPGMAIGGFIGFSRRRSLPLAKDATPESSGLFLTAALAPLIAGSALIAFYIFSVTPWLISVLK